MTRLQARFKTLVARYGEAVGAAPGVVVPLGLAKARDYLADDEIAAAPRPMWLATTAFDHPVVEGDTLAWRTRSFKVKRAIDLRLSGATVARLLVLVAVGSGASSTGSEGGS